MAMLWRFQFETSPFIEARIPFLTVLCLFVVIILPGDGQYVELFKGQRNRKYEADKESPASYPTHHRVRVKDTKVD